MLMSEPPLACSDPSEEKIVENFLKEEGMEESKKMKILGIIKGMGEFDCIFFSEIDS